MRKLLGSFLVAALAGAACHTMVPMTFDEVAVERPGQVYVTRDDRSVITLSGPQVFGDTIVGYIGTTYTELDRKEVARVEIKRSAKGKTIGLVAASIAAAAGVGIMISGIGEEGATSNIDCFDQPEHPACMGQGIP